MCKGMHCTHTYRGLKLQQPKTSVVSSEFLLSALEQTHVLVPSLPFPRRPFSIDALNLPPRTGRLDVSVFIRKAIAAARRSAWSLQRRSF